MGKGKVFSEKWTGEYFSVETNNTALCLTCKEIVSVFRNCNLKRLYMQNALLHFFLSKSGQALE